jgi:hypothetical protein
MERWISDHPEACHWEGCAHFGAVMRFDKASLCLQHLLEAAGELLEYENEELAMESFQGRQNSDSEEDKA